MAIEFALEICTPLTAAQVADAVTSVTRSLSLIEPEATPHQLLEGVATVRRTWIRIRDQKPEPWQTIPAELGFVPTVFVRFRMDKDNDIPSNRTTWSGLRHASLTR